MPILRKIFFLIVIFVVSNTVFAEGIGMVTGSKTGTYIKFGKTIAKIAKKKGVNIIVKRSTGTIDNIKRMISNENAALAIVQSDVMNILRNSKQQKNRIAAKRLKMIFPLYNEEVHVLASKKIKSLSDLNGKTVYFGPKNSGTSITATTIFSLLNINPTSKVHPAIKEKDTYIRALSLLLHGKIDAIFSVSGQPTALFSENLRRLEESGEGSMADKVHFLPIYEEPLLKDSPYVPASLDSKKYDFITRGNKVATIAVKTMLVAYDFSSPKKGSSKKIQDYYKLRCRQIYKISQAIKENLPYLKKNGHEKWANVNLNQDIGMWERNRCSIRDDVLPCKANGDCAPSSGGSCNRISDPVKKTECLMGN
ncbi:MAG: TAXI family TRAP transporter solute-binding subunit [Cocleimonas sp.]|nr:TAXI family TRAP transporter solute-binding subunit [Cocleimonas sp.]